MRIEWTTFALNIVLEQSEYIAETRGQKAAEAWIDGLFARTEQLTIFLKAVASYQNLHPKALQNLPHLLCGKFATVSIE